MRAGATYVGVDLAWGMRATTGVAAIDQTGALLTVSQRRTDEEILAWARPFTDGPCLVAIDAPIVVTNPTGARDCERRVTRHFGRYSAGCHPANTGNPRFSGGSRALRLAAALDLDVDPRSAAPRRAIEVYPHPAIVMLFGLPRILRYKHKPKRDLASLRAELLRLLALIEGLESTDVALRTAGCAEWQAVRRTVEQAATKAALRRVEDSVDAVVCAYVARYADAAPERVRVLGDLRDGYIVTPVSDALGAEIDATAR